MYIILLGCISSDYIQGCLVFGTKLFLMLNRQIRLIPMDRGVSVLYADMIQLL